MSSSAFRPGLRERVASAIVEAAAVVFAARGDSASMSDVAGAAGVARATVYRYFPSRDALLEALGSVAVDEAGQGLAAAPWGVVAVGEAIAPAVGALAGAGDCFAVLAR